MIAYSGSSGSIPARSSAARIAIAPSSVARQPASPPPSFPNGVRTAATITARSMSAKVALLAGQPSREAHDEPDARLDVVERAELARRVHVAERNRDEPGRDAAASDVELVGVGACRARRDLERVWDLLFLRSANEQLVDVAVDHRAALDHRTAAELDLAGKARVSARNVGRPGDIDSERKIGLERERRRLRAEVADLLGDGGDRDDVDLRVAGLADPPCRLERDVAAEAVVERTRDEPPVRQLERLPLPHADVADADARGRFRAVARADVDVQVGVFDGVVPLAPAVAGGDPAPRHDAAHIALAADQSHALSE